MADNIFYEYARDDNWYVCCIIDGKMYSRFDGTWKPLTEQLKAGHTPDLMPRYKAMAISHAIAHQWKGNPYGNA